MMGAPLAVEQYAELHLREVRERARRQRVFNWLGALLVAVVLSSTWWLR